MKSTGIVRRIDDLGRIVIPKEVRRRFQIKEGDPMELFIDANTVIFRKYIEAPPLEGALDNLEQIIKVDCPYSCRMEFLQSLNELKARLKLERDKIQQED